jgi:hypothetical protein
LKSRGILRKMKTGPRRRSIYRLLCITGDYNIVAFRPIARQRPRNKQLNNSRC